jgi:hypothetical protein
MTHRLVIAMRDRRIFWGPFFRRLTICVQ